MLDHVWGPEKFWLTVDYSLDGDGTEEYDPNEITRIPAKYCRICLGVFIEGFEEEENYDDSD